MALTEEQVRQSLGIMPETNVDKTKMPGGFNYDFTETSDQLLKQLALEELKKQQSGVAGPKPMAGTGQPGVANPNATVGGSSLPGVTGGVPGSTGPNVGAPVFGNSNDPFGKDKMTSSGTASGTGIGAQGPSALQKAVADRKNQGGIKPGVVAGDPNAIQESLMIPESPVIPTPEEAAPGLPQTAQAITMPAPLDTQNVPEKAKATFASWFPSIDPSTANGAALLGLLTGIDETGARSAAAFGGWSPDSGVALARQPLTTAKSITDAADSAYKKKLDVLKLDAAAEAARLRAQGKGPASGRAQFYKKLNAENLVEIMAKYPDGTEQSLGLDGSNAAMINQERIKNEERQVALNNKLMDERKGMFENAINGRKYVARDDKAATKLIEANKSYSGIKGTIPRLNDLVDRGTEKGSDGVTRIRPEILAQVQSLFKNIILDKAGFLNLGVIQPSDLKVLAKSVGLPDGNIDFSQNNHLGILSDIKDRISFIDNPENLKIALVNLGNMTDNMYQNTFKANVRLKDQLYPQSQEAGISGAEDIYIPEENMMLAKPNSVDTKTADWIKTAGDATGGLSDLGQGVVGGAKSIITSIGDAITGPKEAKPKHVPITLDPTPGSKGAAAAAKAAQTAAPKPQPTPSGKRITLDEMMRGK